jgi:hypothetical protein
LSSLYAGLRVQRLEREKLKLEILITVRNFSKLRSLNLFSTWLYIWSVRIMVLEGKSFRWINPLICFVGFNKGNWIFVEGGLDPKLFQFYNILSDTL